MRLGELRSVRCRVCGLVKIGVDWGRNSSMQGGGQVHKFGIGGLMKKGVYDKNIKGGL